MEQELRYKIIKPDGYTRLPLTGKKAWVDTLRSGEHKQGTGMLCDSGQNKCCLGVLSFTQGRLKARILGVDWADFSENGSSTGIVLDNYNPVVLAGQMDTGGRLPEDVKVETITKERYLSLTSLNDLRFSFLEIADIIDELWYDDELEIPVN